MNANESSIYQNLKDATKTNAYGKFIALNTYIRNFTKRLAVRVPRSQGRKNVK